MKWIKTGSIFLLFSLIFPLFAEPVNIRISEKRIRLGQPVMMEISVDNKESVEITRFPSSNDFNSEYNGVVRNFETSIRNGKRERKQTLIYRWLVTPLKTGTIVIPPIEILVDGEVYFSEEIELEVLENEPVQGYSLEVSALNPTAFKGQPLQGEILLSFNGSIRNLTFSLGFMNDENWSVKPVIPSSTQEDIRQIKIGSQDFYGSLSAGYKDGEQVTTFLIPFELMGYNPGKHNLGKVLVSFDRSSGRNIFGESQYQRASLTSEDFIIELLEVPSEIEKSSNGILMAMDSLDLQFSVDTEDIRLGDPLRLIMDISGLAYPESVSLPDPITFLNFDGRLVSMNQDSEQEVLPDGTLRTVLMLRYIDRQHRPFPAQEILYLNLNQRRVETSKSQAIDFNVLDGGTDSLLIWESEKNEERSENLLLENDILNPVELLPVKRVNYYPMGNITLYLIIIIVFPLSYFGFFLLYPWLNRVINKRKKIGYPWNMADKDPIFEWNSWLKKQSEQTINRLSHYEKEWEDQLYGSGVSTQTITEEMSRIADEENLK